MAHRVAEAGRGHRGDQQRPQAAEQQVPDRVQLADQHSGEEGGGQHGEAALVLARKRAFGPFAFDEVGETKLPTRTFEQRLSLRVGDRAVELYEVGPAHTRGDVIVHVPDAACVFTGDILFVEGTPIVWEGPVANWIAACDRILALAPERIVPGHGPITDRRGVEAMRAYFVWLSHEARARFDAGMDALAAAHDIPLGEFAGWSDPERIVVNVDTVFRGRSGTTEATPAVELFGRMAQLAD